MIQKQDYQRDKARTEKMPQSFQKMYRDSMGLSQLLLNKYIWEFNNKYI